MTASPPVATSATATDSDRGSLKVDFEMIDDAFKALLQSRPDPMTADKIADLRNMFRDAYTGWLEIEKDAA